VRVAFVVHLTAVDNDLHREHCLTRATTRRLETAWARMKCVGFSGSHNSSAGVVMAFDPGCQNSRLTALIDALVASDTYTSEHFRTEWGPIFYRGRLDGSARLLVIGQDPAAHEAIVRRILCGDAGQLVQGFMAKLGINRSYVAINSFAYSLYGRKAPTPTTAMLEDRYEWIDAILAASSIEAVVTFGGVAESLWTHYLASRQPHQPPVHAAATHPTASVSEAVLLKNWNDALELLFPALSERDTPTPSLQLYGDALTPEDRSRIPDFDMPAGLPPWMGATEQWAVRGDDPSAAPKAARITVTVPADFQVAR
jgi:uracil-DNA glycosylase